MAAYILRRLALILPTLFGIMLLNFIIVQMAPGGPIERIIADLKGQSVGATAGFAGNDALIIDQASGEDGVYLHGIDGETMARLRARFGFDKPLWRRFTDMIAAYATFDFGHSFFSGRKVTDLILEKLPVTLSLGGWSLLLIYLISIPLGIRKAVRDGTAFDVATSWAIVIGYALPGFLLAILLIVLFAGGRVFDWFPLHGLVSDGWAELSPLEQVLDYFWHLTLPVLSMTLGGFATLTMLTKNSFLEEIGKSYVMTARAKGVQNRDVLYRHIFRNAMLVVIAGVPQALVATLLSGSMLIEIIFSLDGLGLLGYESIINRDYPVVFATLFIVTLIALLVGLLCDLLYTLVDPRIDFARLEQG